MKNLGDYRVVFAVFLVAVITLSVVFYQMGQISDLTKEDERTPEERATDDTYKISSGYVELDPRSRYAGGQDAEGDWDIDILEIDTEGDRTINDWVSDKILDCREATVHTIPAGMVSTSLDSDDTKYSSGKVCKPNLYKFGNQSATEGDLEDLLDDSDGAIRVCTDYRDTASNNASAYCKMKAGKTYAIVISEQSGQEMGDFYPTVFLFKMPEVSVIEPDDLITGSGGQHFVIDVDMWRNAKTASELNVEGECSDDQDHDDYSADDMGILADQLTTNTTDVNVECEFDIELTADGVALILENPFDAGSQTYQGYVKVDPYVTNESGSTAHDVAVDGDDYVGTSCDITSGTGEFIYTLIVQGKEIVSDSETDAYTDDAGEKLRSSEVASGLFTNIYDKNSKVTMSVEVNDIFAADKDETDDGNQCTLSDGELIADIELYQPYDGIDCMNNIESNDPELIG